MRMTSATAGSTTSSSSSALTPSRARRFLPALPETVPAPPEDCGGPWGYADLKEALADPGHEDHDDMLEWLGLESAAEFNPAACDPVEINEVLGTTAVTRR